MSFISYLNYLLLKARNPERADFLSEGFGIQARHKRCKVHWAKHLQFSKEFQSKSFAEPSFASRNIGILGAGRLLDVDTSELMRTFNCIELFDADPGVKSSWNKLQRKALAQNKEVRFHTVELTGVLDQWTARLRSENQNRSKEELIRWLKNLAREKIAPLILPPLEVIVSLNLLSQIPIYWRERSLKILNIHEEDSDVTAALDQTLATLQRHHLHTLERSRAKKIILIADEEFLYYKRNLSPWQSEKALFFDEPVALKGYTMSGYDSWFWHIAPHGIEFPDYGVIHRVVARGFTLNSSAK